MLAPYRALYFGRCPPFYCGHSPPYVGYCLFGLFCFWAQPFSYILGIALPFNVGIALPMLAIACLISEIQTSSMYSMPSKKILHSTWHL